MKSKFLTIIALAACFVGGGCDDKTQAPAKPKSQTQTQSAVPPTTVGWATLPEGVKGVQIDPSATTDKNVYLVLDGSGSMDSDACSDGRGPRMNVAKRESKSFVQRLPDDVNVGLFIFDKNGYGERVPLGRGHANRAAIYAELDKVIAGNGTPLGAALFSARNSLSVQAVRQNGYGEYKIVVLTDGEANDNEPGLMDRAVDQIVTTPVILETIGFCIKEGHALNRPGYTVYHDAQTPAELEKGLSDILAESNNFLTVTDFNGAAK